MIDWKVKIADGPDGEVTVEKQDWGGDFDSRLAINLGGKGEYLAVYLTAKEARLIAKALLESVVGVKRHEKRHPKTPRWMAKQIW